MRDYILLHINGMRHEVRGSEARLSLSDYLRRRLGLVGTKIVCSEGDCGACTVLVGRPTDEGLRYLAADSCILFLFQLDSTHVVTIEGIAPEGGLSPAQESMIERHGSQCGFCTPGFVMMMTGLNENHCGITADVLKYGLTGNLCRCTGYVSIVEAGLAAAEKEPQRLSGMYPPAAILADFTACERDDVRLTDDFGGVIFCPRTTSAALKFFDEHPQALVISGATDVGVRVNKGSKLPRVILDLNRLDHLAKIELVNGKMEIGARASWTSVESAYRDLVPKFHSVLNVFGSPQIRNVGTIGGNLINASPIADSVPFLYVMNAQLELSSHASARVVNINDFYTGYKKFDLRSGELLTKVMVPLPDTSDVLGLYKVSRRRDLDISTFTVAIRITLEENTISQAAIAYGGVGPIVLRALQTESFLIGREFCEATMCQAGEVASREVTPISDVRGTADYRLALTRNVLTKFYWEHQSEPASV